MRKMQLDPETVERLEATLDGVPDDVKEFIFQKAAEALAGTRSPSKAHLAGGGRSVDVGDRDGDGRFLSALIDTYGRDAERQQAGKAALAELGATYGDVDHKGLLMVDGDGKATVGGTGVIGTTGPIGMYIAPNYFVDALVEIAVATNIFRPMLNVVSGVAAPGVAIPVEAAAPLRATVSPWGNTKENVDVTYARYDATFYTLARIHDVANQLLRFSRGAAEKNMVSRLGRAFGLGEAYYLLNGAGTTEPTGLLTALAASGAFDTNKAAATTTFATSVLATVLTGIKALELRGRRCDGIVLDTASFWKMATEGDNTTGRPYIASILGGAASVIDSNASTPLPIFGIPVHRSPLLPAATGIIGSWKQADLYTGDNYRIDSSDQAGTRWDNNLTGFRAEEEIAFNATPYVVAGIFQRLTGLAT
jgi:HK97 family phage major capsid protein